MSHLYSDASIGNNIKIWLVKLVDLGPDITVRLFDSDFKYSLFVYNIYLFLLGIH